MDKQWRSNFTHSMLKGKKSVQASWLLLFLLMLSLAMSGISSYRQLLMESCMGISCLSGQLTQSEVQAVSASGITPTNFSLQILIANLFTYGLTLLTASSLIWRKPTHSSAIFGAIWLTSLATGTLVYALAHENSLFFSIAQLNQIVQLCSIVPFWATLPDGAFRPKWMGWIAVALVPTCVLFVLYGRVQNGGIILGIMITFLVFGNLIYRYRLQTEKSQRDILTWTLTSAVLLSVAHWIGGPFQILPLPTMTLDMVSSGFSKVMPMFAMLLVVGALTCLTVALQSDELFRVDVVLNRAIVYSFLTLFVVGSYVLIVGYLSMIFQAGGNLWLSLVATGMVAALFHPIYEWVQRFVNRMIYGERDDPYTVITQLGQRLETSIVSDDVIPTILNTVREALKVSNATIRLVQSEVDEVTAAAEAGRPDQVALTLPLVYQNEIVGQLLLGSRAGENHFSSADLLLLDQLTRQAGAAIHAVRLNNDLQHARERLVIAQEDERRRIRRDLHDGLGSSLAALNLQAGEVQRLMADDPEAATQRLLELRSGLRAAVRDTRRLVYGLRPPALDELGLLEALRSRVAQYQGGPDGKPIQIRLDAPGTLPALPAAVEVAIYRIVEEGIANIILHAQAGNGLITISVEDQGIRLEIRDDGTGLPESYPRGIGLNSMRERASELGGTWSIQSAPGQGTQVCAWLPNFINSRKD